MCGPSSKTKLVCALTEVAAVELFIIEILD
jgi:hypothetical protein